MYQQVEILFSEENHPLASWCMADVWSVGGGGGPLPWPLPWLLLGGGVPQLVHQWGGGRVPSLSFWGVLFHDHFWGGGVPCDLSHNAVDVTSLLSRHQMMGLAWCTCLYSVAPKHYGKVTWHPPHWTDWQTNTCENITFPHYVCGR